MSVIPLISTGPQPSFITKVDLRQGHPAAILIGSFDPDQFGELDSNVCYDLRVGDRYRDLREKELKTLRANGKFNIKPGRAAVIETLEHIDLPATVFATIFPKLKRLEQGIANVTSKVDPGYPGRLMITVFNLGKYPVTLKHSDRFCSIVFYKIEPPAKPYGKGPWSASGQAPRRTLMEWVRSALASPPSWGWASVIVTMIWVFIANADKVITNVKAFLHFVHLLK